MSEQIFDITGMLIPLVYIAMYLLGGVSRPGYSHIANSVTELLSSGAPNRPLLVTIQSIYALLHLIFGYGVLRFVQVADDQLPKETGQAMVAWPRPSSKSASASRRAGP